MLECRELCVSHGKKISAVKGASICVQPGEIVALIGANGAGKTSFLKTISGLLPAESGEIYFEGRAIHRLAAHQIVALGIAHVPEGRHIFPQLSVLENLELGGFLNGKKLQENLSRVWELFPLLKERAQQLGGTLSGGEQQMLAMGRALMQNPKLLLLDEPSMGLSPIMVQKIFAIIQKISSQGATLLLVEQNAQQTLSIAHRAYVLENGKIVLSGNGRELLENPAVQKAYLGA